MSNRRKFQISIFIISFYIFFPLLIRPARYAPEAEDLTTKKSEHSKPESTPLRVISYNIRYFEPPARTDESKYRVKKVLENSQIVKRLAMELELYEPDILTLQEATPKELVIELAKEMNMNYVFFPSQWSEKDWPHGYPGALMTRFEIIESQNCPLVNYEKCPEDIFTRHFGRAVIAVGNEELVVLSAHLLPRNRENSADVHEREIKEILAVADKDRKSGRSILVQGDFNHGPDGFEYKMWTEAGLIDAFTAKGTPSSDRPRRRIDYIWVDGPIAARLKRCRFLFEGSFRRNPEDPVSFALSDHIPVFAVFE